ncbi:MAG: (E)-4-hydroxy-3-methylbut-2-enyl-diphosphate synthase [Opitutus sp.]|nr:(E)-4-hydroxy-3-methylbut-2-enyl-diphosphate synthase [Opitutus sp.]MCS6246491.1 (E)-4-hydroxy-3-methylbut-2-enyl-diphosphate synthase [Opitutus sp.]MCS6272966.1 (E)-4-hydroxy-3-methylbut-2-enyl-diphosphate synthase [Opitutus sp.]MCS6278047.1 (E)-4-hydroxy-3-methylbut-2-enyl-diphosphate synthase [Opitutus sp.]MCS6298845.1 (E)-4-hydroxy-3-methylbut-2-enyl-diphosphate synthase [Opitutus sp.]
MSYCASRFHTLRRATVEVKVGQVGVGGNNPVRVQSMTTSDTQDVAATVKQSIALAEVGCEIVRITAPNVAAAQCLRAIREQFSAAGFAHIPLVADIHFLPSAAMEAVEHVEKIRVNPGNYADKKKFAVTDYTDADYERELQRLHESFSPLVLRAKTLGRALRIGTNHGSLSDRIMNRYGDTPLGMVESALEFLRIAESHGFNQLILSMKSSNPKVMIAAYRLLVQRMNDERMSYPLHLGVTEAGDGEDGRIKSAIGIGSLLYDGLGDTIRVSLTEDSVYEIPVAQALAKKAMSLWKPTINLTASPFARFAATADAVDPFNYSRRQSTPVDLSPTIKVGPAQPPRVFVRIPSIQAWPAALAQLTSARLADTPAEGLILPIATTSELQSVSRELKELSQTGTTPLIVFDLAPTLPAVAVAAATEELTTPAVFLRTFDADDSVALHAFAQFTRSRGHTLAIATTAADIASLAPALPALGDDRLLFTLSNPATPIVGAIVAHPTGAYRALVEQLRFAGVQSPLWIRNTTTTTVHGDPSFLSRLLDAAILTGSLLCDGMGDVVSIETESDAPRATQLAYNVLQGAGSRISKTEFVACPSCGRTLFDLQTTTQRIRAQTGHLKGVKLAIMGCIVNGPGEMADADFGYVGGAPGKINLYVGKTCVQYNIPQAEADSRLIALIKEQGKWFEPPV